MGLIGDGVKGESWDVGKSKSRKKKEPAVEEAGCWVRLRFIGSCISSRSKVDSSVSGLSTHCESKSTNDTSRDHPIAPVVSSTTTSNAESNSSTSKVEEELKVSSQLRKFTFNDLKLATRNFRPDSLLGEGGFGCVFKGWIEENGTAPVKPGTGLTVAVKTLNHDGLQGHKEWLAEISFLGDLIHPNLVKLVGYCIEDDQRLLVYEFMPRGSLENHLFRRSLPLPWSIRMKIALGAAKGLAFLHEEAERPVIYRDFKTSNILLDADYNAKLSDFGLAKDGPEGDKTHVSTRVMGTYGYAAPEYVMTGHLTSKSDVYSFGVVLLEMLTGRRSMDKNRPNGEHNLVEWARPHLGERKRFYRIIDPRLEGHFSIKGAQKAAHLAVHPLLDTRVVSRGDEHEYHKIFQAFGLVKRVEKGTTRWYYPRIIENLVFDLAAFRVALCKPLDSLRLYLSRATLVVVPSNLVDHWKTQIQKHVRPGQLRVYIWTDHKKPCAHSLAWDYDVVLTTFTRLSAEWSPRKRSVLMQVHWHRVMLDEGHTLGASLNLTNKLQMAISLIATNRWLLTGTPTPNTPNSQLSHLQPMLKFLHEEAYGQNQKSWEAGILRPFEAEMEEGRSRLLQLLHRCMISARKVDLQTIPPCIKKVTFLDFTEEHARSYNELVVTVRRNILMADWNDPSHVESLLNPKQWKFRSTTIRNVRLSCCVAGHIKVTDAGQDIQETMDILVENGLDPSSEEYAFIKYNLLYGGSCMRCKEWCRLPVITPCRHLLCLDCVALNSERCTSPGCDNSYEMQSPEILTRPENPNPKWPVPKDLIELQPSYKQDDWDPDWQSTSSSKVAYLVQRLKKLQEANKMVGFCIDEEIEAKHSKEFLCTDQKSDSCSLSHQEALSPQTTVSCKTLPDKVLIFSQFLEHIHVIEQQLTLAGIKFAGMYSPMHSSNKIKSLVTFQYDSSCMALLMDGSAALGLDLSFVTHVFLMEPIWDRR